MTSRPDDDRERSAEPAAPRDAEPDRILERDELVRVVNQAVRRLPERQRIAVVLHRFEGLSYQAIAEVLSSSPDAVDALLRRAKDALRDALAQYGPQKRP